MYINKNLDRGIKDLSLFEIGPIFHGSNPGDQETIIGGLRSGKVSRLSWAEKDRNVDVFDIKKDVIQTLVEAGYSKLKIFVDDQTPNYYHPGKSGRIFLNKEKDKVAAYFGEIHPNVLKKIDIKTEALIGFEIFVDNLKQTKKSLRDQKKIYQVSDFQKSERDFAFIINKNFKSQELIEIISNIDKELIRDVNIFDIYEGENIPNDMKSIALNVTIQSMTKTLNEKDLEKINKLIIDTVENKTGAKIRS
jgi:phenylalanyl-tRNA synthetase beta chain